MGWSIHSHVLCHNFILHYVDTQHQFNARESDWGFTSFMPLGELYDPSRGYLVNDTLVVEAEVLVRRIVDYWTYDSKKETGYVGLKNQGATCYMNSLLQTLYHIPYFRKVRHCFSYCCFPSEVLFFILLYLSLKDWTINPQISGLIALKAFWDLR